MSPRAGFTLLEICLAVAIAVVLLLLAVPSMAGVLRRQRLQKTEERFDDLVRQAQSRAVHERHTMGLVWQKDGIELTNLDRAEASDPAGPEPVKLPLAEGQNYTLDRTAALGKDPPGLWTFWRSGVCEPATVTYQGAEGRWTAVYDPLTARRVSITEELP